MVLSDRMNDITWTADEASSAGQTRMGSCVSGIYRSARNLRTVDIQAMNLIPLVRKLVKEMDESCMRLLR